LNPEDDRPAVERTRCGEINTTGRRCTLGVRRVPLPTRGDHAGGALVRAARTTSHERHDHGDPPQNPVTPVVQVSFRRRHAAVGEPLENVRNANNRVEADRGRRKARLRPMRGLKRDRSLRVVATGHAFVQNLRRGHYELARPRSRIAW